MFQVLLSLLQAVSRTERGVLRLGSVTSANRRHFGRFHRVIVPVLAVTFLTLVAVAPRQQCPGFCQSFAAPLAVSSESVPDRLQHLELFDQSRSVGFTAVAERILQFLQVFEQLLLVLSGDTGIVFLQLPRDLSHLPGGTLLSHLFCDIFQQLRFHRVLLLLGF